MSSEEGWMYAKVKISDRDTFVKIMHNEITKVEGMADSLKIHLVENNRHNVDYFRVYVPMIAIQNILPKDQFERTSKFFIHNKKYKND